LTETEVWSIGFRFCDQFEFRVWGLWSRPHTPTPSTSSPQIANLTTQISNTKPMYPKRQTPNPYPQRMHPNSRTPKHEGRKGPHDSRTICSFDRSSTAQPHTSNPDPQPQTLNPDPQAPTPRTQPPNPNVGMTKNGRTS